MCLKDRCGTGTFAGIAIPPAAGSGQGIGVESSLGGDGGALLEGLGVFLWTEPASGFRVDVEWFTGSEELRNGDAFRVALLDASGKTVSSLEENLTFSENYPNGKECDLTPCKHAEITDRLRDR